MICDDCSFRILETILLLELLSVFGIEIQKSIAEYASCPNPRINYYNNTFACTHCVVDPQFNVGNPDCAATRSLPHAEKGVGAYLYL